ncbi:MAG: hypothetical protein KA792_01270 [Bacteroidales bacterium]|nr:hypothetical protein [Bacteroidales bacterium]
MKKNISILFFLIIIGAELYSQCFSSPGNPIGGNANLGNVELKLLRFGIFYKYALTDKYLDGDKNTDFIYYDKANYNYIGNIIAYGLTNKLTIESECGYFINKTVYYDKKLPYNLPEYSKKANGLSSALLNIKYGIYNNNEKRIKYSASIGVKAPFNTKMLSKNNVILPVDVQPSTGSFGIVAQSFLLKENSLKALRFFMINRYEINFENNENYKYGNVFYYSLFISKHLHFRQQWISENWTAILQLRNEYRDRNLYNNNKIKGSGSILFYLSPQLNYSFKVKYNISVLTDIPLYQYYNDVQLANKFSILVNMTTDIVFK